MAAQTRLVLDVSADIDAASELGAQEHVRYAFRLLLDVISESVRIVRQFYGSGKRPNRMGAHEEPGRHWQQGTPPEILENMYVLVAHYQALIRSLEAHASLMEEQEARSLDHQRIQYLREMALRVQTGKMGILKKDPDFWTEKMELDFKEMLEYRLSK
jgi:hypothetical protein